MLELSEDREVAPRYGQGFGRRPDVLQFPGDVMDMAKKGATSFHVSEERWSNPLQLKAGMTKRELDLNRKGWDLILDIDTVHWDYAKLTAYFLIEAIKFHDVKNVSIKFSGNKGFHIGIPFESFPDEVNGVNIKNWFPEGPRIITEYLENMIWDMLAKKILDKENITDIAKKVEKPKEELMKDGKFNPFVLVDIDTILISNRHLFRSVYSLHEKSMLASVPIPIEKIMEFEKVDAEPENIETTMNFLDRSKSVDNDAKQLLIQAFDWHGKKHAIRGSEGLVEVERRTINVPKNAIPENHFPKCIEKLLEGKLEDGKKRALFVLINFLKSMNWRHEDMVERLKQWNKSNKQPLSPSYFIGQMNWHKKQKETVLPPNCSNNAYYRDIGIACEKHICEKLKNPVNCAKRSQWIEREKKKKQVRKVKKVKKKVKPKS